MLYSNTGVSGSVTGVGSGRQLVLYYWLIPNHNTDHHIGVVVLVRSICVGCTKGLECGGNGNISLGGTGEAFVCFTGLLDFTACGGVGPSSV